MSFTNFTTGTKIDIGGEFRELVPNERLVYTDKFDDPNLPGEMRITVTLKQVSVGTELRAALYIVTLPNLGGHFRRA